MPGLSIDLLEKVKEVSVSFSGSLTGMSQYSFSSRFLSRNGWRRGHPRLRLTRRGKRAAVTDRRHEEAADTANRAG
jgi:hypothetical protein